VDEADLTSSFTSRCDLLRATWQLCQVHVIRNLLGHAPARERASVLEAAQLIFASADLAEARCRHGEFAERFARTAPKAVACMDERLTKP
jgi:putative transposase